MSLVEFKTVEYQGSKQVVASDEIKQQILKIGIRKLERQTRVSHHTLERVLKGEPIRRKTLAKIMKTVNSGQWRLIGSKHIIQQLIHAPDIRQRAAIPPGDDGVSEELAYLPS